MHRLLNHLYHLVMLLCMFISHCNTFSAFQSSCHQHKSAKYVIIIVLCLEVISLYTVQPVLKLHAQLVGILCEGVGLLHVKLGVFAEALDHLSGFLRLVLLTHIRIYPQHWEMDLTLAVTSAASRSLRCSSSKRCCSLTSACLSSMSCSDLRFRPRSAREVKCIMETNCDF